MSTSRGILHSFEFCEGQRKGSVLLYVPAEKQLYKLKSKGGHIRRYVCYNRRCKATAKVDSRWPNILQCRVTLSEWHATHQTQEGFRGYLKLSNAIKKKSASPNLNRERLREIFDAECRKDPVSAQYLSFPAIQRQLLNIRNQTFPNDPRSSKEVEEFFKDKEIMKKFGKSQFDTTASFYATTVTEQSFSYTIFISPTIAEKIDGMSLNKRYYLDTRYKVPNSSYKNLMIIHIELMEQILPFIYILMSDRKEATYSHVFRYIDANIFQFCPYFFMFDNDIELEQCLKTVFPKALRAVSWFHYCQAVRRRAKSIKFFPRTVRLNNKARTMFQKFLALPLMRTNDFVQAFSDLRSEINENENLRAIGALFDPLIGYVEKEWVQKTVTIDGNLKYLRLSRQLEDFNTRVNKNLLHFHGFFKCVSFLLDEDHRTCARFSAFFSKLRLPLSRDGPNDANFRIAKAAGELRRAEISISEYFKKVTKRRTDIRVILEEGFNDPESDEDSNNDDVEEQPALCIICRVAQRSVLLFPCRHVKLCGACYFKIDNEHTKNFTKTRCPLCRQVVKRAFPIFC